MAGTDRDADPKRADELIARARTAMEAAYAPYSRFRVGAALESEDGRIFEGCNVENASYPVGTCAERVALGHAVTSGARRFTRIAIVSSGARPASPCGMCRQALVEFGAELVVIAVAAEGERTEWRLGELLPAAFRQAETERSDGGRVAIGGAGAPE
jgi:cytidine deaminase